MSNTFTTIPSDDVINKTVAALQKNNFIVFVVENEEEARKKTFELIPEGMEVMNNTSVTLEKLGIAEEIMESGKYNSVKKHLMSMDRATQERAMKKLGAAPDYAIGSVHAITQNGHVMIASGSGSQLPGYAYASAHVIWVAGAQKIVANMEEGMKRIYEHALPLENERALKAYGTGSDVRKLLIVNNEARSGRITLIIIKKAIGF